MRHLLHKPSPTGKYKSILLIKESAFSQPEIEKFYITPLSKLGYDIHNIFSMTLEYNEHGKAPAKLMKAYIDRVLKAAKDREVTTLLVADAGYFKQFTKERKAEPHYGYIKKCAIPGYENIQVILTINYQALFYKPELQQNLDRSLTTMMSSLSGFHIEPGTGIIHSAKYYHKDSECDEAFTELFNHPVLTVDVETRGLQLSRGMLGTIAFAWDQHNGIAINISMDHGYYHQNRMKEKLTKFFENYPGKCIYHGATFDIKVLIFELFMTGWNDKEGMIKGLEIMTKNIECTKIITYLATNSTSGNTLDLKSNAAEFAGNYAQDDIDNIETIPLPELLEYNLVDCLSTWFIFNKNHLRMITANQQQVYDEILRPSIKLVTKMELVGMPLEEQDVRIAKHKLSKALHTVEKAITNTKIIIDFEKRIKSEALVLKNSKYKKKVVLFDDYDHEGFNPNSNQQVAHLLHDQLKLDVIDLTPTKQPSVGAGTLKKHLNQLISKYNLSDEDLK